VRIPGARVAGHSGAVLARPTGAQATCSCDRPFPPQPSVSGACLALVLHLQGAVRDGARVVLPGDDDGPDDGLGGVREPRGPLPSVGSGGAQVGLP
jgi:hypothetical protein